MNAADTSTGWTSPPCSEPMPSSTPTTLSISPSTCAPWRSASATTSIVWRVFSATSSSEPSNSTEFQPASRQVVIHDRSGQWSRWSVTGTGTPSARARHIAANGSAPSDFTVFTDVWTMSGASSSVAAARTASSVRSSTTLIAATPYRSAKARSRISRIGTTGIGSALLVGAAGQGRGNDGPDRGPSSRR